MTDRDLHYKNALESLDDLIRLEQQKLGTLARLRIAIEQQQKREQNEATIYSSKTSI